MSRKKIRYKDIKTKQFKLALVMIVKPSDEEAVVLRRCLNSVAPYVDDIFLTITGENEKCEEVAEFFNAKVSHFEWVNSFAKARNFALEQVPKDYDYWMWLDCDDVLRGGDYLRRVIANHPQVDSFILNYLYHFDEYKNPDVVHMKTRILKHDGCVKWVGDLHEDFEATRQIDSHFIQNIDVLHLTDDERVADSKERNVIVAEASLEENKDDPRTYWNLGNAYKASGKNKEAMEAFEKFMESSQSEEEKYIISMRMAEVEMQEGNTSKALDHVSLAIGTRPKYPDAYLLKGHLHFQLEQYEKAIEYYKEALTLEPPYHQIIVYNPRAYDYEPMISIAKCYFQMGLPNLALPLLEGCLEIYPTNQWIIDVTKELRVQAERVDKALEVFEKLDKIKDQEKFKAEFEKIDVEIRSHPMLCRLYNAKVVKKESSGKDLVFFCGFTEEEWSPKTAKEKGIGGSEEAVIHLSRHLTKLGWNVTVYNNCGHKELEFDGVTYKPFWMWNPANKEDVTILWRSLRMLEYPINSDKVFIDLHDVIPEGELNEKRLEKLDKIFVKSKAHQVLFPSVPEEKFAVIPNGIVWDDLQQDVKRDSMLLINTSSPDRGLRALLECFKEVKKQVPEAKLKWAYGWGVWDTVHGDNPEMMKWKEEVMKMLEDMDDVEALGRVSHGEVARLYQEAGVFAYPTAFYEIDCISARKAQAGGSLVVATDFAALEETIQHGAKVKVDRSKENWDKDGAYDFSLQDPDARERWIKDCVTALKNPITKEGEQVQREWAKQFDWEQIAKRWHEIMK